MPETVNTHRITAFDVKSDDDRDVMVDVEHVSMVFNMASEKLNSLKEYFIALAKRELFFESFVALDNINFQVKKGDVFGILGTNGSGKSTMLKIIAGVLSPTSGNCKVRGNIAPLIELGAGFDMELSARENIFLNGALLGYPKTFIEEHFDEIVKFAEIEKFLDMPMKNYSSGMVARIAFAIATVIVPDVLIVDEVLSVGDFVFQQKCEDRINELISQHSVTVLIVSHSNEQIERLCNKAIWIEKGHVRMLDAAPKVCDAYRVLGGRQGNKESEELVFDNLLKAQRNDNEQSLETIRGENMFATALRIAHRGWGSPESVVLVPSHTHAHAVMALGIAGHLGAPILPYNYDDPIESIRHSLVALHPQKALVIEHEDLVASQLDGSGLRDIAEIKLVSGCDTFADIRNRMLLLGMDEGAWNSDAAFAALLADSSHAFAAAPYAYAEGMPFMIYGDESGKVDEKGCELLKRTGVTSVIPIGSMRESNLIQQMKEMGFSIRDPFEDGNSRCVDICRWIGLSSAFNNSNLVASSGLDSHWSELIGIGPFAGKLRAPILLENPLDLDDVAACIKYVSEARPTDMTFVGSRGLSDIDKRVLWASSLPND